MMLRKMLSAALMLVCCVAFVAGCKDQPAAKPGDKPAASDKSSTAKPGNGGKAKASKSVPHSTSAK